MEHKLKSLDRTECIPLGCCVARHPCCLRLPTPATGGAAGAAAVSQVGTDRRQAVAGGDGVAVPRPPLVGGLAAEQVAREADALY